MLTNIAKRTFLNLGKIFKNKEEYSKTREEVLKHMDTWKSRLNDQPYHGGNTPDEADFYVRDIVFYS